MGARQKLNGAFFNGSLLLAGVVGAATGSWWVFGLALAIFLAFNIATDRIRIDRRNH